MTEILQPSTGQEELHQRGQASQGWPARKRRWEQELSCSWEQTPLKFGKKENKKGRKRGNLRNGSIHKATTKHETALKWCQQSPTSFSAGSDEKAWTHHHLPVSHQLNKTCYQTEIAKKKVLLVSTTILYWFFCISWRIEEVGKPIFPVEFSIHGNWDDNPMHWNTNTLNWLRSQLPKVLSFIQLWKQHVQK